MFDVAAGTPLNPVIADIFLFHHEKKWLNEFKQLCTENALVRLL